MHDARIVQQLKRRDFLKAGIALGAAAAVPATLARAVHASGSTLFVGASLTDTGTRPVWPFWDSPYILFTPHDAWDRVAPGSNVTVSVLVQNGDQAATGVTARFWWANPSLGIPPVNFIGVSAPASVAANSNALLVCPVPWVPIFVNGGHECLLVEIDCDQGTPTFPFRPDLDPLVGQRNVTVLAPIQKSGLSMPLQLANPFPEPGQTQVTVSTRFVRNAGRLIGHDFGIRPSDVLVHIDEPAAAAVARQLGLIVQPADPGTGVTFEGVTKTSGSADGLTDATRARLRSLAGQAPSDGGRVLANVALPGLGVASATFGLVRTAPSDAAVVHQFRQLTNGVVIGGYAAILPPG
jgi:TAT (twin-arginine translocation) pathway signal sequence